MNRIESSARRGLLALVLCALPALAAAQSSVILILGDSLSAEYGLPRATGWVGLLEKRLGAHGSIGSKYSVVNASISGETTIGGRGRIARLLEQHAPAAVVIELGANDGLRGLPLDQMRANLLGIVEASQAAGAKTLLIGMRIPPNYGRAYTSRFDETFAEIAKSRRTGFVPFLLEGIAERPEYFQPDRLHPNLAAQPLILENVWPALARLLGIPVR
jgi:acyl-CoA thioesterase-1